MSHTNSTNDGGETLHLDQHPHAWDGYGNGLLFDGYRAWASIKTAQDLLQVLFYSDDGGKLMEHAEPLLTTIAFELDHHPDRYARLLGWTLFTEVLCRHPDIITAAVRDLRDELWEAAKKGQTGG